MFYWMLDNDVSNGDVQKRTGLQATHKIVWKVWWAFNGECNGGGTWERCEKCLWCLLLPWVIPSSLSQSRKWREELPRQVCWVSQIDLSHELTCGREKLPKGCRKFTPGSSIATAHASMKIIAGEKQCSETFICFLNLFSAFDSPKAWKLYFLVSKDTYNTLSCAGFETGISLLSKKTEAYIFQNILITTKSGTDPCINKY